MFQIISNVKNLDAFIHQIFVEVAIAKTGNIFTNFQIQGINRLFDLSQAIQAIKIPIMQERRHLAQHLLRDNPTHLQRLPPGLIHRQFRNFQHAFVKIPSFDCTPIIVRNNLFHPLRQLFGKR